MKCERRSKWHAISIRRIVFEFGGNFSSQTKKIGGNFNIIFSMKIPVRINSFSYNTTSKHLQYIKLLSYDWCKITFVWKMPQIPIIT